MPRRSTISTAFAALLLVAAAAASPATARSAYDFTFENIDGGPLPLEAYRGRPMLVVNTASFCGFTPQFEGLQALWTEYRDRGFVLIGAPSQDFRQEHDDIEAVKNTCEVVFGIDFPMTNFVSVRGPQAHPFFAWAASETSAPSWNFNKYLIDREGRIVRKYGAADAPEAIAADIEALLTE